ncbi:MAG TPA: hypothetical protein VK724_04855 [Bryobacteraceae bacterium]|jgi:hypothetical protein|nr:hypothetical protein [Bryobacteraceae bacterium]
MAHRLHITLSALAFLGAGASLAPAQSLALAAKPATTSSTAATSVRTADGRPDLEGYWTNTTVTPLERPKELADKAFFTPEEAAEWAKRQLATPEPTGPGTYADVHYNMAQFGLERSQSKVAANIRTSLITDPPDGHVPPMTPEARQRNADRAAKNKGHEFDGPENRGLAERCIMWGNEGPPMMPVGYNSNLQIVQGPGYVAITQEMIHDVRMIPTDGSPHLPADVRQWMGDSRGHWEGDTLVVDTTNFTDKTAFRGSSANLHVVERFRRVDADTVLYQFTVDDPSTWAHSWSAEIPMTKIKGPIFEYACHEGNYGMRNNLSGARADEKKQQGGK